VIRANRLILGTAGHIDHGKTALVRALTGVDTDRLPEEKARGITIDLGFAELQGPDGLRFGVVDVPGHEDFVRTMVAGATGMDLALMVIAADEGVMPQTREHLDIIDLLGVPALVVALTKVDLVEPEWLALVGEDVREFLRSTRFAGAPVVPTSSRTGAGIDSLRETLEDTAQQAGDRRAQDLARLPVDRIFTVRGTGTVVTGTLWSGSFSTGDRVRLAPGGLEARIRTLQVHGRQVPSAQAGERTAVALTGIERARLDRGMAVVSADSWIDAWMLTIHAHLLPHSPWSLESGQRVRVLLGTSEVLGRCAVLEGPALTAGMSGWVQLRLEAPVVARAGDHVVIRSYSPMTTIGGGEVAEPSPPKRKKLSGQEMKTLSDVIHGDPPTRVTAVLDLAQWDGIAVSELPVRTGLIPSDAEAGLASALKAGGVEARRRAFSADIAAEAGRRILAEVDRHHAEDSLSPSVPLDRLRARLPEWAATGLADAVIGRQADEGALELAAGGAKRHGFSPSLSTGQLEACARVLSIYVEGGLGAPFLEDLPQDLRDRPDLSALLRHLEREGRLVRVDEGLLVEASVLLGARESVAAALGGRIDLGPSDFREVLPVSRKHLMPLLAYLDGVGVTVRRGPVRDVPERSSPSHPDP
jgi:selenocysteine-specific elongation factor